MPRHLPAAHLHPEIFLAAAVVVWLYIRACRRNATEEFSRNRAIGFGSAIVLFLAVSIWPVHEIAGDYLYAVHMAQHLTYSLLVPPLLIWGVQPWMWPSIVGVGLKQRVLAALTKPIVAFVLFNVVVAITHVPDLVALSARSQLAHGIVHAVVIASGLIMWSSVIGGSVALPVLSYPGKMFYLFGHSLVPTVPASFLTFGSTVLYRHYAEAPRLFALDAISDQRIAGLTMKLAGGFLLWTVIAYYFFKWHRIEHDPSWSKSSSLNVKGSTV